jgi:hypothetical protein
LLVNDGSELAACSRCGRLLGGDDPDEDMTGDAGRPICGECARERDFFDFEVEVESADDRDG